MHAFYVLTALSALDYASSLSLASTDCECAVLFNSDVNSNRRVFSAPSFPLDSCYDTRECKTRCTYMLKALKIDGNPQHLTPEGLTVADYSCKSYGKDIYDGQPAAYYKVCDTEWLHIQDSKFKLCCEGGSSVPCQQTYSA